MASGSDAEGQDVAWVEQTVPLANVARMLRPGAVLPLPGMQVETRLNIAPVLLGGLWFASGLVLGVVDAATTSYAPAIIPFVGPVLSLAHAPASDPSGDGSSSGSVSTMPILAGLSQIGGAAVLVVGLLTPRRYAIFDAPEGSQLAARRATPPRWALLPAAPGAAVGATFSLVNF
jgi:hypothetical protein